MTGPELRDARKRQEWTQVDFAGKLGVSQGYVSLLESDRRDVPQHLLPKLVALLGLPASSSPSALGRIRSQAIARLAHSAPWDTPALPISPRSAVSTPELLVRTLRRKQVEARLVEALPWVLLRFPNVDWPWLVHHAKQHDLQNRLGFVVTIARGACRALA